MKDQLGSEPLKDQYELFCHEYLKDLNVKQAAIRAGYSERSAGQSGHEIFHREDIRARIDYLKQERAEALKIEAHDVLQRLWFIATADPRDLVKHKLVNCRFCWGIDHLYQWIDEAELDRAIKQTAAEERDMQMDDPTYKAVYPTSDGGFGFRRSKPPHPECPSCDGEGKGYIHIEDTSTLSESAQLLYAGAKQTKEGVEVKMHDQMAALKLVGQHIGLFIHKVEHSGAVEIQSLSDLMDELSSED